MTLAVQPFPRKVRFILDTVKLEHSVFMLPFAYTGMVLAAGGFPTWWQFFWITLAMVAARTLGFCANRVLDRDIDALNPRTAQRHLVAGRLKPIDLIVTGAVALGIFLLAAAELNPMSLMLAPIAAFIVVGYSYTKRFTWTTNLIFGLADGLAVAGGWVGVSGTVSWNLALLYAATVAWVIGFETLQECRDTDFIQTHGLHSVPARWGIAGALRLSQAMYALAICGLVVVGLLLGVHWPFYVGLAGAAALLAYQHVIVRPNDLSRAGYAFFPINGYVSATVFAFTLLAFIF